MNLCPVAADPMIEEYSTPNAYDAARILVVDDYVVDRRIAGGIVEKITGTRPAFAANGMDAIRQIAENPPSVVLTDLQMPEMDGLRSLFEEIRERFPRLPRHLDDCLWQRGSGDPGAARRSCQLCPQKGACQENLATRSTRY